MSFLSPLFVNDAMKMPDIRYSSNGIFRMSLSTEPIESCRNSLEGRTILISGASSGLGAHFATVFVASGANVVLGARRVDRIKRLAKRIGEHRAMAVEFDVSDEQSIIEGFQAANRRFGTVHTIIANAGVSLTGKSTDTSLPELKSLIDVNLVGAFLTAREGARRLLSDCEATNRGRIVLIGSITARQTGGGLTAYAASKAALAHMGRNLAKEWVTKGISVNILQPGYIDTELAGEWFKTEAGANQIAGFPRKRLQPIETLDAIAIYLSSDAASGMTGAVIDIDDGQSL
jgi:NAD(P)-dependent dehydrogenase (short-subunit alcohol dehydrogenase family)